MEQVMGNSTKVLVDVEGGNNMLYLPLDKIMESSKSNAKLPPYGSNSVNQSYEPNRQNSSRSRGGR
jgi:membrane protease subunit HflK